MSYLFVLFVDDLGFLMPLKPHHVLGVKSPALFLERLGGQVLRLCALHVVKHEEQCFCRQPLIKFNGV